MGAADPFGKLRACFSRRGLSYHGLRDHPMTLRLGWFSSGRGPGSRRLLATVHDEVAAGRLDASIAFVFCNREPGQDPQTDLFLEPYPFEIGMLAGYMLIATELLCERYDLLNLHPAAPDGPAGAWQEVIWRLIEERAD